MVFAAHHGVDATQCASARRYLRARDQHPDASAAMPPFSPIAVESGAADETESEPPFGYFHARDILLARPDRALHGVAVSNRGTDGQLLAYVEYFEFRRCIVRLAETYLGPDIHAAHFIDPVTGETVHQDFDLAIDRPDVEATFRGERAPGEQMLAAFSAVMSRALRNSFERERTRVLNAAIEEGLAACGLQPGQEITAEHASILSRTIAERFMAFVTAQRDGESNR